jgi:hypothetical protein
VHERGVVRDGVALDAGLVVTRAPHRRAGDEAGQQDADSERNQVGAEAN